MIVFGIGQKIYGISIYNNKQYEVVEGVVRNVEPIYANNSYIIRGIHFSVNNVNFTINNYPISAGYSYSNGMKIKNDDQLRIYYIKPRDGTDVSFILRIDAIPDMITG